MSRFAENLRRIRFERHMTQEEFAQMLGTTKQNISRYESGAVSPKISTAQAIADKLGLSLSDLNCENDPQPLPHAVRPISDLHHQRVPLIGEAAAGAPIYAPEDLGVYVDSPVNADAAITVRGDSMEPTYLDGDLLYIKCVPDVPEGAVAVVFLDDEATVKHVYKRPSGLTLIGDNRASPPVMVEYADYDKIRVFGVPVGYTRIYKQKAKVKKGI